MLSELCEILENLGFFVSKKKNVSFINRTTNYDVFLVRNQETENLLIWEIESTSFIIIGPDHEHIRAHLEFNLIKGESS